MSKCIMCGNEYDDSLWMLGCESCWTSYTDKDFIKKADVTIADLTRRAEAAEGERDAAKRYALALDNSYQDCRANREIIRGEVLGEVYTMLLHQANLYELMGIPGYYQALRKAAEVVKGMVSE